MADTRQFTMTVQDPILQKVAQIRNAGSWEDIRLPIAELVDLLEARMDNVEGRESINTRAVTSLSAEMGNSARSQAVSVLFNRADFTDRRIEAEAGRIDSINLTLPTKADLTAVNALTSRVTSTESEISIDQENLVYLSAQLNGITLGPTPNVFTGATEMEALAALEAQTVADPDWTQAYLDNGSLHVRVDVIPTTGRPTTKYYRKETDDLGNKSWVESEADFRASQTAVESLIQSLNETDGRVSSNQQSITSLTTTIGEKADVTALDALSNRVTVEEGNVDALQTALTNLTTEVGTKATLVALEALTNRVTTEEGNVDALQTALTSLTTEVGTKASLTAINVLSNRVTDNEGEIDAVQESIVTLEASIATKANLSALNALTNRVNVTETTISAEQAKLTALTTVVSGKAETTAVNSLTGRVSVNENSIAAINSEITTLESRIVGTALGPETNAFTGANRATAEAARDTYFAANPAKLAQYDADSTINIRLTWGVLRIYQFRRGNAWVDNGEVEPTATAVTSLNTSVIQNTSAIAANVTAIEANATSITNLRSEVGGVTAVAFTELTARVTSAENVDGTTTLSGLARWLVKTQVNDLVGGIGLYNDGSNVDLIVNANRFAVVPPGWTGRNDERRVPFAVVVTHTYTMTWGAFSGTHQYRTSSSSSSWGPWQNAPASRRVVLTDTANLRFQVRAGTTLSNIETFIPGDSDEAAPSFPAPQIVVNRTSRSLTYIDSAAIRDASILGAKIRDATITNAHIVNATILGAKIADAQIGNAHIIDATILGAKIGLAQINNAHIIDATIDFAKIKKGDIFDLTIGNCIQSSNYQSSGTRTIPAERATVNVGGITFTHNTAGTGGNGYGISIVSDRGSSNGITVGATTSSLTITLTDPATTGSVNFDRADIATAVNNSSAPVMASGTGDLSVDFSFSDVLPPSSAPSSGSFSVSGTMLSWGAVAGATSYDIYYNTAGSSDPDDTTVADFTSNTNSVTNANIADGNEFWVRARNSGGVGPWSSGFTYRQVVRTTNTDTIWRRSPTTPSRPAGGTSTVSHQPSGWSRSSLSRTSTNNVYRCTRTRTYADGTFESATAWSSPSRIATASGVAYSSSGTFTWPWDATSASVSLTGGSGGGGGGGGGGAAHGYGPAGSGASGGGSSGPNNGSSGGRPSGGSGGGSGAGRGGNGGNDDDDGGGGGGGGGTDSRGGSGGNGEWVEGAFASAGGGGGGGGGRSGGDSLIRFGTTTIRAVGGNGGGGGGGGGGASDHERSDASDGSDASDFSGGGSGGNGGGGGSSTRGSIAGDGGDGGRGSSGQSRNVTATGLSPGTQISVTVGGGGSGSSGGSGARAPSVGPGTNRNGSSGSSGSGGSSGRVTIRPEY